MKRRLTKLAVFLLLGAIVNVAVAWGCALWVPLLWNHSVERGHTAVQWPCWWLEMYKSSVGTYMSAKPVLSARDVPGGKGMEPGDWETELNRQTPLYSELQSVPIEFARPPKDDGRPYMRRAILKYGWPVRSFMCTMEYEYDGWWDEYHGRPRSERTSTIFGGKLSPFKPDLRERVVNQPIVPLRPIWSGVVLNTVSFAVLWTALVAIIRLLRLTLRYRSLRGRLVLLGSWLVLGIVSTITVAWLSAAFFYVDTIGYEQPWDLAKAEFGEGFREWVLTVHHAPTVVRVESKWRVSGPQWGARTPPIPPEELLPHWAHYAHPVSDGDSAPIRLRVVEGRGWPAVALWSAFEAHVAKDQSQFWLDGIKTSRYGMELAPFESTRSADVYPYNARLLPLGINLAGFIVDTLVHAAAWSLATVLAVMPWALRRVYRTRRGLCITCGYDLRGAEHEVCPECGHELTVRARR